MDIVTPARITLMANAIELGVDAEDFRFSSTAERHVWDDLVSEIDALTDKDDLVWLPSAA